MGNIRMRRDVVKIREIKIKLLHDFFYQKGFIVYNYIIMGTQRRNYKHGDQKHLHRSIMAITSGPKYLKHKNIYFINI